MDAYYWLGCAYDEGRALPEDPQKAAECFDRCLSCEWCSNHIGSANMLGSYYFEGRGVPQDYAKAYQLLSWAFLASREEVNFGAYYLAKCCFEGLGTQQDYELAWKYLQRVDWKNSNADYMRGYLFCNGLGGLPEDRLAARPPADGAAAASRGTGAGPAVGRWGAPASGLSPGRQTASRPGAEPPGSPLHSGAGCLPEGPGAASPLHGGLRPGRGLGSPPGAVPAVPVTGPLLGRRPPVPAGSSLPGPGRSPPRPPLSPPPGSGGPPWCRPTQTASTAERSARRCRAHPPRRSSASSSQTCHFLRCSRRDRDRAQKK